ncbi:hypothetical protein BpHYR1_001956 [Brachionus plicatilis]|uniref:Uncharacterized protein n=1 Tax=Brachionus plicatilis TaxID=10195 RepID=A0A3M7RUH1_BRAPC|nr:hypothetical protein BpHYR1_001956 [Brachionus plicatilis]
MVDCPCFVTRRKSCFVEEICLINLAFKNSICLELFLVLMNYTRNKNCSHNSEPWFNRLDPKNFRTGNATIHKDSIYELCSQQNTQN